MSSKRRRHSADSFETYKAKREIQRLKRRQSDRTLLRLIVLGAFGFYFAFELGRSLFYMQTVKAFAASIAQMAPAEVKVEVQQFSKGLYSPNPLIQNGAVAALKVATGWNLGAEVNEWKNRWALEEPYWQYRSSTATNAPTPPAPDWRKELPAP